MRLFSRNRIADLRLNRLHVITLKVGIWILLATTLISKVLAEPAIIPDIALRRSLANALGQSPGARFLRAIWLAYDRWS